MFSQAKIRQLKIEQVRDYIQLVERLVSIGQLTISNLVRSVKTYLKHFQCVNALKLVVLNWPSLRAFLEVAPLPNSFSHKRYEARFIKFA